MLLKLPYLVVFGELCLFQMGAVHVEQLLSMAQTKVNALHQNINSLQLTIRMCSKSSFVRHLFKIQNVLVLRNSGINDGWEGQVSPPKPI